MRSGPLSSLSALWLFLLRFGNDEGAGRERDLLRVAVRSPRAFCCGRYYSPSHASRWAIYARSCKWTSEYSPFPRTWVNKAGRGKPAGHKDPERKRNCGSVRRQAVLR